MPLISIILPTYNVEKYIARALESCINQTLKDIEIIVVDDKGQDNSIDIAKNYASNDDRIKIIHNKENLKLLHARAEGVKVAKSELIMFLDPDDELELNACEIAYNAMVNGGGQNTVDVVIFNAVKIKDDKIYDVFPMFKTEKTLISIEEYKKDFINFGWNVWNRLYIKKYYMLAIDKINNTNYKGNMAEDALLTYFITYEYNNKILLLNEKLYKYYINETSITNSFNYNKCYENIACYKQILNILKTKNDNFTLKYKSIFNIEYIIYAKKIYKKLRFKSIFHMISYIKYKLLIIYYKNKDNNIV